MDISYILEKLKGTEAQIKELADHIKKLEAHLPAAVLAAIVEMLNDPGMLKLMKKLVNNLYYPLRFKGINESLQGRKALRGSKQGGTGAETQKA